jgi:pSer/pThr/pTyr-binding forkhead associated (FHA) protein
MILGIRTTVRRLSGRIAIAAAIAGLGLALLPRGDGRAETAQRTPTPERVVPQSNAPARENVMGVEQSSARTPSPAPTPAAAERRARERAVRRPNWGLFAVRGEPDWEGWSLRGVLLLLTIPGALLLYRRPREVNAVRGPGFEVISPSEARQWIPLEEKYAQLDFVTKIKTRGALRLSANLNKVSLSNRKFGYLMEDKNFRNALLVNRRRVRRTLLKDGDVLDLGDMTLLYRDHRAGPVIRYSPVTPPEGKAQIKFDRPRGPVRRGIPILFSESQPARSFLVSKNLVFIGRSEDNDLIIKSQDVHNRHAKIERVGGRYKLQDLSMAGSTYVNGRRVDQRFLREGDEVSIDSHRFKFSFVARPVRERPQAADAGSGEMPADTEEAAVQEEVAAFAGEQDGERADAPPRA